MNIKVGKCDKFVNGSICTQDTHVYVNDGASLEEKKSVMDAANKLMEFQRQQLESIRGRGDVTVVSKKVIVNSEVISE